MQESLVELLACPICKHDKLELTITRRNSKEIRQGTIRCRSCTAELPIEKGIVHALFNVDQKVLDEAQGWVEVLDVPGKQHEFQDEWILSLPFIRPELTPNEETVSIWHQMGRTFFRHLDRFDWRGKQVLEIGASRCWGVAELARRGADTIGLDILTHKYIGLETGDIWLEAEDLYFERVLGDMHNLPFADGSLDFVLTTASLHHTDTFQPALREIKRVLNDDGRAFFINEPLVPDWHPKPDMSDSVEVQHNIIESRLTFSEWMAEFMQAGFVRESVWMDDGGLHVLLRKGPSWAEPLARSKFLLQYCKYDLVRRGQEPLRPVYDRLQMIQHRR